LQNTAGPLKERTGLPAKVVAPDFALLIVERGPRLDAFNNVTVPRIAPSTARIEETEAVNRGRFDRDPLAPTRQPLVNGVIGAHIPDSAARSVERLILSWNDSDT
jgi:hypothetical protein